MSSKRRLQVRTFTSTENYHSPYKSVLLSQYGPGITKDTTTIGVWWVYRDHPELTRYSGSKQDSNPQYPLKKAIPINVWFYIMQELVKPFEFIATDEYGVQPTNEYFELFDVDDVDEVDDGY